MKLACTHCGKRLSRKTARQVDGVVMCSTCLFLPASERARPCKVCGNPNPSHFDHLGPFGEGYHEYQP